jgi:hypothetical protein
MHSISYLTGQHIFGNTTIGLRRLHDDPLCGFQKTGGVWRQQLMKKGGRGFKIIELNNSILLLGGSAP